MGFLHLKCISLWHLLYIYAYHILHLRRLTIEENRHVNKYVYRCLTMCLYKIHIYLILFHHHICKKYMFNIMLYIYLRGCQVKRRILFIVFIVSYINITNLFIYTPSLHIHEVYNVCTYGYTIFHIY